MAFKCRQTRPLGETPMEFLGLAVFDLTISSYTEHRSFITPLALLPQLHFLVPIAPSIYCKSKSSYETTLLI